MTQPLTQQQITTNGPYSLHDMESGVVCAKLSDGSTGEICNTQNGFGNQQANAILIRDALNSFDETLIATLEARVAAFEEMLEALKDIARQKTTRECEDDGDFEAGYDACIQVARSAIAHAEKVK